MKVLIWVLELVEWGVQAMIKLIEYPEYKYDSYLETHIQGVVDSLHMVEPELRKYLLDDGQLPYEVDYKLNSLKERVQTHDSSKYLANEYKPYVDYFYGNEKTPEVVERFDLAWNHHQKRNPHHWQYWLLIRDEGDVVPLPMQFEYVVEMLCDWHSFSRKNSDSTAYNWYNQNKDSMKLHQDTIELVEHMLEWFKDPLK